MNKTVTLSIKNVPVEIVELLKQRASANHRSLQGELMAIIEAAAYRKTLSPGELLHVVRESASRPSLPEEELHQQTIHDTQGS